jgi:striatin 1/3/4
VVSAFQLIDIDQRECVFFRCLQEISYLTSPAALNPLPNKLGFEMSLPENQKITATETTGAESTAPQAVMEIPPRPKKTLDDAPPAKEEGGAVSGEPSSASKAKAEGQKVSVDNPTLATESSTSGFEKYSDTRSESSASSAASDDSGSLLTAIYKPESKEAWKEALRSANEKAEKVGLTQLSNEVVANSGL